MIIISKIVRSYYDKSSFIITEWIANRTKRIIWRTSKFKSIFNCDLFAAMLTFRTTRRTEMHYELPKNDFLKLSFFKLNYHRTTMNQIHILWTFFPTTNLGTLSQWNIYQHWILLYRMHRCKCRRWCSKLAFQMFFIRLSFLLTTV